MLAGLAICCGIMKMSSQYFPPDRRYQTGHPKVCKVNSPVTWNLICSINCIWEGSPNS
jgi:hypothetical protein